MAQFLERWLEHIRPQVAPRTFERYAEIARKNIAPALGGASLGKLQPMQISAAYSQALISGRRDGKGGLSPQTVRHMHRVLSQALGQATRWNMLPRNPADLVDPPKVERRSMKVFDVEQAASALDLARSWRVFIPALLAGLCGLREGEIAALRWRHVDLDRGHVTVVESAEQTRTGIRYKELKRGGGRKVSLPASVAGELRAWRLRQAEELLRLGVRLADDTFVCAREDGLPIKPSSIYHAWTRFLEKSGLPRIRFHDLRHSHATHLLLANVHPKIVSEWIGHSRVSLTLDTYSHVLPGMQEDAVARIDAAFGAALNRRA